MRHASILDGKDPQRVSAENFHLLLADPDGEIGGRLVRLILMVVLIVMGQVVVVMTGEDGPNAGENEQQKRSHYECLESINGPLNDQSLRN